MSDQRGVRFSFILSWLTLAGALLLSYYSALRLLWVIALLVYFMAFLFFLRGRKLPHKKIVHRLWVLVLLLGFVLLGYKSLMEPRLAFTAPSYEKAVFWMQRAIQESKKDSKIMEKMFHDESVRRK